MYVDIYNCIYTGVSKENKAFSKPERTISTNLTQVAHALTRPNGNLVHSIRPQWIGKAVNGLALLERSDNKLYSSLILKFIWHQLTCASLL